MGLPFFFQSYKLHLQYCTKSVRYGKISTDISIFYENIHGNRGKHNKCLAHACAIHQIFIIMKMGDFYYESE